MSGKKSFIIICIFIALSVCLAVSGCITCGSQTASPTPMPTAAPSATPTAEPTATPTPAPAATPAPTAEPTATPMLEPVAFYPTVTPGSNYTWPGYDYHWTYHEPAAPTPIPTGGILLTIDGDVDNPLSLTLADLQAYPQYSASMTIDGETISGTGPNINDLFASARPVEGANGLLIYYNDTEIADAEVDNFAEHEFILAIRNDNTLEIIRQGYEGEGGRILNVTKFTLVRWK